MDLKIRKVPSDEVYIIDQKAKKKGVSREEFLRQVISKIVIEDELLKQQTYHKEVLGRLIDTVVINNQLMDAVATHFGIEIKLNKSQ